MEDLDPELSQAPVRRQGLAPLVALGLWLGLAALAGGQIYDADSPDFDRRDPDRATRVALFSAPGFPTVDAAETSAADLKTALDGFEVERLDSVSAVNERLRVRNHDLLVLPYGSAFPLDAWKALRSFVDRGGSLVVLGGAPFHQPVLFENGEWRLGTRQATFADPFLISPAEPWNPPSVPFEMRAQPAVEGPDLDLLRAGLGNGNRDGSAPPAVWHLTVRLARHKDLPSDDGSEGHRDAILRPLAHWVDPDGLPRACPLLEIDRLRGGEAGARWVFAPTDAALSPELIRWMVQRALHGAAQLEARPIYATLEPSESAQIQVAVRRPWVRQGEAEAKVADLVLRKPGTAEEIRQTVELTGTTQSRYGIATLETQGAIWQEPGFYEVEVQVPDVPWIHGPVKTGFWRQDRELLTSGPKVTVSRDWLRVDGEVLPVIGTTYMASDVHRKYLFEPNPWVFEQDFAEMKELGVNFIRTGLWTGHSRVMLNAGVIDEAFLRALDAYVHSAARHGIVLNFTFFAFLPPAYGGSHAYLDPRALEGQRELLTLVARRYRGVGWVHWDLINEPSYGTPDGLWRNQPVWDEYERQAWTEWVGERHGQVLDGEGAEGGDSDPGIARIRDRWRDASQYPLQQPTGDDMAYGMIRGDRHPRKAGDFVRFSNHVVTEWARYLRSVLREAGGDVLVTLGQDEGGTLTRPSQQLHAEAVDYTGVHPWWQNDDLLATGLQAKVPEKPSLFQETGIMRLEGLDGWPWRSPDLAARLLERKFAYAFASRNAGIIEWAWNINPYQPKDMEPVIGFWRPDGTAKPELDVFLEFAEFFKKATPFLDDYEPDPVVAVIPHSRLYMARPGATDGFKRVVRLLADRFGVVPAALSELRLSQERLQSTGLAILPSPEVLEPSAATALKTAGEHGTKTLLIGPLTSDALGEVGPELTALVHPATIDGGVPVRLRESTQWGNGWATFDRNLRENLPRSSKTDPLRFEGSFWHEPLPLDHAREDEPLVDLLGAALDAAGIATQPTDVPIATRLLYGPRSILVVLVNETGTDLERELRIDDRRVEIPIAAERSRLLLFERPSGRLIASTPGGEVKSVN